MHKVVCMWLLIADSLIKVILGVRLFGNFCYSENQKVSRK